MNRPLSCRSSPKFSSCSAAGEPERPDNSSSRAAFDTARVAGRYEVFTVLDIPKDEGSLLIDIVSWNQVPDLKYPAPSKYEWQDKYAKIGGTPFTLSDKPAELFLDLDPVSMNSRSNR
jgi:hypothetical protein